MIRDKKINKKNEFTTEFYGQSSDLLNAELEQQFAECKKKEEELLKSVEALNYAQKISNTGSWEFDFENQKTTWSENTYRIFGIKPFSVVPTYELFSNRIHARDKHLIDETLKKVVETKAPQKIEFRIVYAGNKIKWIKNIIIPTFKHKKLVLLRGVNIDITERKKSEEELNKAMSVAKMQEKFSKISADISTDLIDVSLENLDKKIESALAKTGKYATANRAFIYQFKEKNTLMDNTHEWCAQGEPSFIDIYKDVPVPDYYSWMKKLTEKEHILIRHVKNISDTNIKEKSRLLDYNITSLAAVPILKGDEFLGFLGLSSITEKKHWDLFLIQIMKAIASSVAAALISARNQRQLLLAKEKAEESDRLKSAFLANMSHEIRTPMNGILGFVDLLRNVRLTEKQQNLYYEMVKKSSDRLLTTINDIIEISKIESGQTPVIYTVEDVREMMQYLLVTFLPVAEEKGLDLTITEDNLDKPLIIKTDKIKLEIILKNLIRNAIKFTDKGMVKLGYELKDKTVFFCISDTGPGIAKERLNAIFDRFVQADLNLTRPYEGSGLGLAITRAYAEMLRGELWVESEIGKGSKFYFSLNHNSVIS